MKLCLALCLFAGSSAWTAPQRTTVRRTVLVKGWFDQKPASTAPSTAGGSGGYVPAGMSAAEYKRVQDEAAKKAQASRAKKRGSHMTLEEAQRSGVKTFVTLKGDAVAKTAKKGWLNPFGNE